MSSGTNVGNVFLTLKATGFSAFQKSIKNQGNKAAGTLTKTFSSAFSKIGTITAAALSTRAIKSFVKESIDIASDLAEVQNVVDVTFGESAKIINDFAEAAPKAYGWSTLAAKQYTGTIGAMLKSMRIAQNDVLGMSTSIASLAGDTASFYNLDTDTAFEKIRSGISGETEPLKQLGINLSVANLEQYRLNKGITTAYNKMSQADQAILRYNYLLEATADAQGDFSRTSNSWANQTRILALNIDTLKASVGNLAIQALTPLLIKLNQIIEYATAAAQALTKLFGGEVKTFPASSGMSAVSSSAVQAAGDMTDTAKTAKKTAKAIKASFADFDEIHLLGNPKDDSSAGADTAGAAGGQALSPMSIVSEKSKTPKITVDAEKLLSTLKDISAIAVIIGATIGAWKLTNFLKGLGLVKTSGLQIAGIVAGILTAAYGIYKSLTEGISWLSAALTLGGTTLLGVAIGSFFSPMGALIGGLIGFAVGAVTNGVIAIIQHWGEIKEWWNKKAWPWLCKNKDNIVNIISGLIGVAAAALVPLTGGISLIVGAVAIGVLGIVTHLKEIKGWWTGKALPWLRNAKDWIINLPSSLWNKISSWFNSKVKPVFTVGYWKSKFSVIGDALKNIINTKLLNHLNNLINKVNSFLTIHVGTTAAKVLDKLGVKMSGGSFRLLSIPNVPYLEPGAYMTKNNPTLAVVGDNKREGEIVSPESKIREQVELALAKVGGHAGPDELFGIIKQAIKEVLYELQFMFGGDWHIVVVDERGDIKAEHIISAAERKNRRDGKTVISLG